jgi:hypothetical protein
MHISGEPPAFNVITGRVYKFNPYVCMLRRGLRSERTKTLNGSNIITWSLGHVSCLPQSRLSSTSGLHSTMVIFLCLGLATIALLKHALLPVKDQHQSALEPQKMKVRAQCTDIQHCFLDASSVVCVLLKLGMHAVEAVMMQPTQLVRSRSGRF